MSPLLLLLEGDGIEGDGLEGEGGLALGGEAEGIEGLELGLGMLGIEGRELGGFELGVEGLEGGVGILTFDLQALSTNMKLKIRRVWAALFIPIMAFKVFSLSYLGVLLLFYSEVYLNETKILHTYNAMTRKLGEMFKA
ncbi:MAG: hypothetical protein JKY88_11135 [Pseudomonadales bacterium]|nr:hypothetical protein [Pseudomonadales bacterium]